eukprot:scaffold25469_cov77-Cyclotella_meneghiniana.AAC.10
MTPFKVFDGTLQRPLYLCTMKAPPCGVDMEMEQRLGLLVNVSVTHLAAPVLTGKVMHMLQFSAPKPMGCRGGGNAKATVL